MADKAPSSTLSSSWIEHRPTTPVVGRTRKHTRNVAALCAKAALFWSRVAIGRIDECWPWKLCRDDKGYGRFFAAKRESWITSRAAWTLTAGAEPSIGLDIGHACNNPACCNPAHLVLQTHAANMAYMAACGRGVGRGNRRAASPVQSFTGGAP